MSKVQSRVKMAGHANDLTAKYTNYTNQRDAGLNYERKY